ncbi:MAG: transposase [Alphaproteobacteria bacterium]|nr:transposase [Alphaproteobacteria bacterium]
MPASLDRPLLVLLRAEGRECGEAGADAPHRRAVFEVSVLRLPSDGPPVAAGCKGRRENPALKRPDHVWCSDITYIPVRRGFLYLVAIMDWATRHVLAWRLSNTMDVRFRIDALRDALARYGKPEVLTPTRAASSPASTSPACLRTRRSRSPWTGGVGAWQHLHRAPVAVAEIRGRLPARDDGWLRGRPSLRGRNVP